MASDQLEDGIIRLLFRLHDLVLDTPDAPSLLAQFVQRLSGPLLPIVVHHLGSHIGMLNHLGCLGSSRMVHSLATLQ